MRSPYTYVSIFSGIEAASVAWGPLGFKPLAFAEVDLFPSAVLKKHYPHVPNLGDVAKIDWSEYRGKVDILVGGSPCQSFSIAGNREGLSGESGLMREYIRAVREIKPQYFIWENVPGALSSEEGGAFHQLLSEADAFGYGLAWRVFDSQFFGVAQRRRRVFLVGSLGDMSAVGILFEPNALRWDHPSSQRKRESLANVYSEGCLTPWETQSGRVFPRNSVFPSLVGGGKGNRGYAGGCILEDRPTAPYGARRLTPIEWERLQGFPDNWTQIAWNGKPEDQCPNSCRYKVLGNSMAVPVMRWIGEGIALCGAS